MQKISDPLENICPVCGGRLRKDISISSFQLKGSGWYVTDYARKSGNGSTPEAKPKDEDKSKEKAIKKEESSSAPKKESEILPEKETNSK